MVTNPIDKEQIPNPGHSLFLALLAFFLLYWFATLAYIILGEFVFKGNTDLTSMIGYVISSSLIFSYSFIFYWSKGYARFLFRKSFKWQPIYWSIGLFIGIIMAFFADWIQLILPPAPNSSNNLSIALNNSFVNQPVSLLLTYLSIVIIAPFCEEYLFRGVIFDSFEQNHGFFNAVLLSAVVFTSFHLLEYYQYWPALVLIFILALLLTALRHYSQSIISPIIAHISYNCSLLIML